MRAPPRLAGCSFGAVLAVHAGLDNTSAAHLDASSCDGADLPELPPPSYSPTPVLQHEEVG
eukprot:3210313-Alexandrium_andersonii.AAC.1